MMRKHVVMAPVILLLLATVMPVSSAGVGSSSQNKDNVLASSITLPEWDLASAQDIRFGRAAAIRRASGDILDIRFLSKDYRSGGKTGGKPAVFNGEYFLISNFDSPPPHSLGGQFGAFQSAPSSARLEMAPGADGRGSLVLTATREKDGWCGAWIHLIETNGDPLTREFLNGEAFSHLVFWIRGSAGGPEVNVKLADAAWFKKDDSAMIGPISSFLPSKKIEPAWQLAVVPLAGLPAGFDRKTLAVFVLELISPGPYRLEVKGLALTNLPGALPAGPPNPRSPVKATWIWNTEQIMASRAEQSALLSYLTSEGINQIYLNLPFKFGSFAFDETEMGGLIMLLQQKGIRTSALFGDKELALPRNHAFVKNAMKDIIAFNSRVAAPARFAGVHLDIEPNLLRGFYGTKRAEILGDYLRILADAARLARSGRLPFGADMPSWFDAIDAVSGEALTAALDGKSKPVYEHVIDICDQVTLKNDSTSVSGVGGTVAQAVGELAYAAKTGKTVVVGLETLPVEDMRMFTFRGAPAPDPYAFPNAPYFACVTGTEGDMTLTILKPAAAADFRANQGGAGKIELWWPVYAALEIPGASVSFAALGTEPLMQAIRMTVGELSVYPSFAGIAVHDYAGHRKLLSLSKAER